MWLKMSHKLNVAAAGYSGNKVTANNSYTGKIITYTHNNKLYIARNIAIGTYR